MRSHSRRWWQAFWIAFLTIVTVSGIMVACGLAARVMGVTQ